MSNILFVTIYENYPFAENNRVSAKFNNLQSKNLADPGFLGLSIQFYLNTELIPFAPVTVSQTLKPGEER